MEPRIIKSEEQHRQALHEVERLAAREPDVDSVEGARLELFAKLVDDYEKERYPFARPDPVAAILFRMEQQGLRQKDVAHALGGKNRASEVLARKRPLTLAMIRRLVDEFAMSPALLIREPAADYSADAKSAKAGQRELPRRRNATKPGVRADRSR
jgi:HTH-type transcriptional regulator / antitoxin HigA